MIIGTDFKIHTKGPEILYSFVTVENNEYNEGDKVKVWPGNEITFAFMLNESQKSDQTPEVKFGNESVTPITEDVNRKFWKAFYRVKEADSKEKLAQTIVANLQDRYGNILPNCVRNTDIIIYYHRK